MFTPEMRDFMVLYLRMTNTKPVPNHLRIMLDGEKYAFFAWEFYAGMGNQDFMNVHPQHQDPIRKLINTGLASVGEVDNYMGTPFRSVEINAGKILTQCPKGRTDMPAYSKILNSLESPKLWLYKNSRRAAFVDTLTGKQMAYQLSAGELRALKFLLDTGFLVETIHKKAVLGSQMNEVMLSAHAMPKDITE